MTGTPTAGRYGSPPSSRTPASPRRPARSVARSVPGLLMAVLVTTAAVVGASARTPIMAMTGASSRQAVDVQRIDSFVRGEVARHGIPGLAIGVVDGNRTILARGYGTADSSGRAVTARTPFVLASVSKPLTATAVMQLVRAGRVDLDEPVQRYLPEFRVADRTASGRITVRDLLTHTSGLPASGCERDAATLQDFVASLSSVTLAASPGSRFIYCSGNYNILGRLVERVSGESFGRYIQRHVFGPLRMTDSYTSEAPARADGLAQGHRWIFGEVTAMHHYNPSGVPSGYLISSAQDMSHFLSASMDGGQYGQTRLLSSRTAAAMQRRQVDSGDGSSYGLGWRQGSLGGVPAVYHFGENYDTETLVFMEPQNRRGAVILSNGQGILATMGYRSIENGVARLLDGRPARAGAVSVPTLYAGFDIVAFASLALAFLPLVRLGRWASRLAQRPRLRVRSAVRIAVEVAVPVVVVVLVRLFIGMIGASWHEILLLVPDVVGWLLALCAVVLVTGLLHAIIATRVLSRRRARSSSAVTPDQSRTGQPLASL
jgi:CubicO group peptidase (beta-lactamase class C family)